MIAPDSKHTGYEYNAQGLRTAIWQPNSEILRYAYTAKGQLHTETDPLGRPLSYLLANKTQHVEYDEVGRMIAFIDELGQRTTFEYDNMDRVIRELAFDGREKRAAFNLAGELVYSFDNDNLSEYQDDTAGRLFQTVSKNAARDETIQTQYYYDDLGQLQEADQQTESHLVQVSYQRDAAGRIIQEAQTVATRAGEVLWHHPVQHGYSAHGVRIQTQMGSLPAVNWLTYGSGHILGASIMGNELIEFTRDRLHRERSRRFGYLNLTQTYDVLERLTQTYLPQIEGIPRYQHYHYDKPKYYGYGRYASGIGAVLPVYEGNIRNINIPNLKYLMVNLQKIL